MKKENSYDISKFNKDLKYLKKSAQQVASSAIKQVVEQQTAFTMSFDEAETMPIVSGEQGALVFSVANKDPVELEELVTQLSLTAVEELKLEVISGMREVLNGRHS